MSLLELQRQFAASIMGPLAPSSKEARAFIKPNDRLTPLERLDIYRRSYWARILDALRDDFPGLCAILGPRAFRRLSKAYLSDSPSSSFTLRDLGSRLEAWLREHPAFGGKNLELALDMVRLEWAHVEAFDSAAEKPLGPEDLLELGPDMTFGLQPHLRLLEVQYPVDDLRIRAQKRKGGGAHLQGRRKLARGAAPIALAVHRADLTVFYRRLALDELRILSALRQGASIGEAVAGMEGSPDLIETWFASWSQLGWLCRPANGDDESQASQQPDRVPLPSARADQKRKGRGAHLQPSQQPARAPLPSARANQKRKGRGAHLQPSQQPARAALRFARANQKRKGRGAHLRPSQQPARAPLPSARANQERKGRGAHLRPSQQPARAALRFARANQKRKGRGAHLQPSQQPARAALRFARVHQDS